VYSAIARARTEGEQVFFVGFADLWEVFPSGKKVGARIPLSRNWWWLWDVVERLIRVASVARITRLLQLNSTGTALERTPGLTPITLFDGGFCQDPSLLDTTAIAGLQLNRTESHSLGKTFFVHVRRGDYLSHPSKEYPAAIAHTWFTHHIKKLGKRFPGARFLVFSDDVEYCLKHFSKLERVSVVDAPLSESFHAMSHCDGGILSASSLSWWAAYLASTHSTGPFIAPRYWIRWPESRWDDPGIEKSDFLEWAVVPQGSSDAHAA